MGRGPRTDGPGIRLAVAKICPERTTTEKSEAGTGPRTDWQGSTDRWARNKIGCGPKIELRATPRCGSQPKIELRARPRCGKRIKHKPSQEG